MTVSNAPHPTHTPWEGKRRGENVKGKKKTIEKTDVHDRIRTQDLHSASGHWWPQRFGQSELHFIHQYDLQIKGKNTPQLVMLVDGL